MSTKETWFPKFKPFQGNLDTTAVQVDEYLPPGKSMVLGLQHAFAMFGATVLAPLLMGFDPNLTMFITGIGTILFFLMTGGRMPSYLGSSFAFIGAVIAVTGYTGVGLNPNLGLALGGTIACGILYALIGLIVMKTGTAWIEKLMPPIVTGAIVMIIGLHLAPVAIKSVSANQFDSWMALITIICISVIAVFTKGMIRRLLLLIGLVASYFIYFLLTNVLGFGTAIDFTKVSEAAWFGLPTFHAPVFEFNAMLLIAPVAIILVAENLGHFKAVLQ
ncbi:Permease family protein [Acinetobacter sp. DSM 11652]|nr:Permease family protein [Acinetobacter sp. DSM 11652]